MLVLGALLHLETSTLFELCHKLVRRARYQKRKRKENKKEKKKKEEGKGTLIAHTRVKTTTPLSLSTM